jgi:hypothetical protein
MDIPTILRPDAIHPHRASFCRAALLLITIGSATCVFTPGDSVAHQPESERPPQNAADYYRHAAAAVEQLSTADKAMIESTGELQLLALYGPGSSWSTKELVSFSSAVPSGEVAMETAERLEPALHLFRQGAQSPECDWGFDFRSGNLSTPIPHLPIVPDLVRCALFRARYNWAVGMKDEAVHDLQALKQFARHVGADGDGGLISLVVQFNIERVVVYTICRWLEDPESARMLKRVAQEPDRPPVNLAKKALLLETETILPLAKQLIDTSQLTAEQRRQRYERYLFTDAMTIGQLVQRYSEKRLLAQIEQSHDHYYQVGRLLDLLVDEFQPEFDKYVSEVAETGNYFSGLGLVRCPGIERVYYDIREMRVRWRILQAAIDIYQSGLEVLQRHKDPFGDGPFEYSSSTDGFALSSRLIVNGAPVTMRF